MHKVINFSRYIDGTNYNEVKNTMEKCVLQFRCAKNGQPFCVGFQRASSQELFKIVSTWTIESRQETSDLTHQNSQTSYEQNHNSFDHANFDFTGWCCPHCGHRRNGNISDFIQCGSCRELVCSGRLQQLIDGSLFFTCHNGCGNKGKVEGEIKGFQGVKRDIVHRKIN